jgi:hypothetical protein
MLRCTGKVLALLRVSTSATAVGETSEEDWYANLVWVDRRKCLLVTHAGTLFSVFVPNVTAAGLRRIGPLVVSAIETALRAEGLPVDTLGELDAQEVTVAKTADRRILGTMNDLTKSPPSMSSALLEVWPAATSMRSTTLYIARSTASPAMSRRSSWSPPAVGISGELRGPGAWQHSVRGRVLATHRGFVPARTPGADRRGAQGGRGHQHRIRRAAGRTAARGSAWHRHTARLAALISADKTAAGWRPLKEAGTDDPDRACWRSSCTATWRPEDDPEKSNS